MKLPLTNRQVFLIILSLVSARFLPFIFGYSLFWGDNYSLLVPGKLFTAGWLKQGLLPLWNPTILGGISWIGDISQSLLYPSTALFMITPPAIALKLTLALHLGITMWGALALCLTWGFSRPLALLGALWWGFSTQLTGSMNNLATLQSLTWTPWIFYSAIRLPKENKHILGLASFATLQLWGGYPQFIFYSLLFAVILSYIREKKWTTFFVIPLRRWLVACILFGGLSAFIWMPFSKAFLESTRMQQTSAQAQVGSLHPLMLLKLISPYFFDLPILGMRWGPAWSGQPNMAMYFTWLPLVLLIMSVKRLRGTSLALLRWCLLGVIISFGGYLPFYQLLQKLVPLLQVGRYPSMLLAFINLGLILVFLSLIKNTVFTWPRWLHHLTQWLGLGLGLGGLGLYFYGETILTQLFIFLTGSPALGHFHTPAKDRLILLTMIISGIVSLISLRLSLSALYHKRYIFLLGIIGIDMWFHTQGSLLFGPDTVYPPEIKLPWLTMLTQEPYPYQHRSLTRNFNSPYTDFGSYWEELAIRPPFSSSDLSPMETQTLPRLNRLRDTLTPNWNMVANLPYIHGYTTLLPTRFSNLFSPADGQVRINYLAPITLDNPALDEWAVGFFIVDNQFKLEPEMMAATMNRYTSETVTIYERPTAKARFRYLTDTPAELTDFQETPNWLRFTLKNNSAYTHLLMADRYDSDWKARINDRPKEVVNHQEMRLIALEAGENKIQLSYEPFWFRWGYRISIAFALLILGYVWHTRVRRVL